MQGSASAGNARGKQRQTRAQRSAATREKLLDGAYQILLELGHVGLRSANVSEVSGVSRGGQLHHFATKEQLIAAVYERTYQQLEDESWERIAAADSDDVLRSLVEDARQRFFSDTFRVLLDIHVASGKEKPLLETLKTLSQSERPPAREGWAARLAAAGVKRELADKTASFLWNCVKGLAVRALVAQDKAHEERVLRLALDLASRRSGLPAPKA